jgi:polysaccharide deacetylase family protein (PEP-CTERM system associated)
MAIAVEIDREEIAPSTVGAAAHDPAHRPANAFSVDVEDYFQVEAFKGVVDRNSWDTRPARVETNTDRVLRVLDAAKARATFFVLGWVAERFPALVRRIQAQGHELASHGYDHGLARELSRGEFREDVRRAKVILEDCAGVCIRGFRAPTFSIDRGNWWAYDILGEEGYAYSSSTYPVAHDLYGVPDAPRTPFRPVAGGDFVEIPIATLRLFGRNRACGGGGYFRLRPYGASRWCIRRVNRVDGMPCVFYCHPWEFDPDQPRFRDAPLKSRVRHYLNLGAMENRVSRLLRDFAWGRIDEVFSRALRAPLKATIAWTP